MQNSFLSLIYHLHIMHLVYLHIGERGITFPCNYLSISKQFYSEKLCNTIVSLQNVFLPVYNSRIKL